MNDQKRMDRKYQLIDRGMLYVNDMLKQKIRAEGIRIKRYDERCLEFQQNNLFRTNQKLFYERLDGGREEECELPDPTETTRFWNKIWSDEMA